VVSIDLGSIISGTAVRGSFEEKFRALLKDIEEEKGKVIIFIGMSRTDSLVIDH
jgi:ATP-dependent Clp protease ATP-binding subunit ClpB